MKFSYSVLYPTFSIRVTLEPGKLQDSNEELHKVSTSAGLQSKPKYCLLVEYV